MAKKIIITIDGWSSCGKSTLAKQLANALGYVYIDSGAMYRAITLYFLRKNTDWSDEKEVTEALNEIHLHFEYNPKSEQSEIFLNEENVEYLICLLYTSDAADERSSVDLGGRRIIKKKKMNKKI